MRKKYKKIQDSLITIIVWITSVFFMYVADITPEDLFNMFFGGFGGATMSGGKKAFFILCTCIPAFTAFFV